MLRFHVLLRLTRALPVLGPFLIVFGVALLIIMLLTENGRGS